MMLMGTHTMVHATLVGHREAQLALGAILVCHHLINALHWCHCSSHVLQGLVKWPLEKQTN